MTTGEKIREARKRVNLTQKQLGELIGVSGAMIGQYETGIRNPKTETLKKLTKILRFRLLLLTLHPVSRALTKG